MNVDIWVINIGILEQLYIGRWVYVSYINGKMGKWEMGKIFDCMQINV